MTRHRPNDIKEGIDVIRGNMVIRTGMVCKT